METERTACNKITLRQLNRYFAFVEVQKYSKLIMPYMDCEITDLGVEKSVHGNNYVIRVVIRVPEDYDEAPIEVDNGSVLK